MPTVSVIIPCYNGDRYILETIRSVQNQSFTDFELIVINDGSTDRTLELLNTIQDSRLKVISCENAGLPAARNLGLDHSVGEFITFLDADDLWTADKLERQLAALREHPSAGVVYSWTLSMDESGQWVHPGISVSYSGNVYRQLLLGNFIASGSNVMLRRQVIDTVGKFDPTLRSSEDWDYWLRIAPHWNFVVVPQPQILYRQSSATMSSQIDRMEHYSVLVIERAFQAAPPKLQALKNQSLAFLYQHLTQLCLTRVSGSVGVQQATQMLMKSIKLHFKSVLDRKTQKLLFKIGLSLLISPKLAELFTRKVSHIRATSIHELAIEHSIKS